MIDNQSHMDKGDGSETLLKFHLVFNEYFNSLCFFAGKIVNDKSDAEDIVEEIFIKLWQKEPDFSKYRNLRAVLFIAVKNACLDHLKKRRRSLRNLAGFSYTLSQEAESFILLEIVRAEVIRDLYAALECLPAERRNVMRLIYVEGWDSQKVAENLNISVHTVKKHRLKGIRSLKEAGISFGLLSLLLFCV